MRNKTMILLVISCLTANNAKAVDILQLRDLERDLTRAKSYTRQYKQQLDLADQQHRTAKATERNLSKSLRLMKKSYKAQSKAVVASSEFHEYQTEEYTPEGSTRGGISYYGRSK
jgi:hypothetical protein